MNNIVMKATFTCPVCNTQHTSRKLANDCIKRHNPLVFERRAQEEEGVGGILDFMLYFKRCLNLAIEPALSNITYSGKHVRIEFGLAPFYLLCDGQGTREVTHTEVKDAIKAIISTLPWLKSVSCKCSYYTKSHLALDIWLDQFPIWSRTWDSLQHHEKNIQDLKKRWKDYLKSRQIYVQKATASNQQVVDGQKQVHDLRALATEAGIALEKARRELQSLENKLLEEAKEAFDIMNPNPVANTINQIMGQQQALGITLIKKGDITS